MTIRPAPPATPAGPRLYLREDELLSGIAAVFEAAAVLKTAGERARSEGGLTWSQVRTLIALARAPDTVMGLAARLSVTKQALTRTLEELEAAGLLERIADPRDRRRRITRMTARGQSVLMEATSIMRQRLAQAYRAAGGDAVAGADQVLGALRDGPARTDRHRAA